MNRWRIDFAVRELGVPEEEARGIKFGDDVELEDIMDFFDRCRNAVRTLLGTKRRQTLEELRVAVAQEKRIADTRAQTAKIADGSRGGDGPPDSEWLKQIAAINMDPFRDRY
jgi:hypothetical protein